MSKQAPPWGGPVIGGGAWVMVLGWVLGRIGDILQLIGCPVRW